jgi:putative transposase
VIADAHEGIKAAVAKVLHASWQRCRVHFMRNVLAHAGRQGRRVVAAFIGTAFVQDDAEAARTQWRQVADQLRPKVPKLAALMDEAEADVPGFMTFPKDHRPKIHSINPLERLNGEIKSQFFWKSRQEKGTLLLCTPMCHFSFELAQAPRG